MKNWCWFIALQCSICSIPHNLHGRTQVRRWIAGLSAFQDLHLTSRITCFSICGLFCLLLHHLTGYWRNPAPHLYKQSAVRINITKEGVNEGATLMFQMIPYKFDRQVVINGNQVLVGGNSFAGTYNGISNLYSAFYDTFWTMAATGKFVGSDQKVMYRTCHTYPESCHIHSPKKTRSWLGMLGELLPGVGGREKIKEPLKLEVAISPEEHLPLPPNGIVDNATSELIWKGIDREG